MLVDREGLVWAGTPHGLTRITKQAITTLSTAEGLPNKVVNPILQQRDGSILIGSYLLTRFAEGKLTSFPVSEQASRRGIEALYEDPQGVLWIGSKGEASRISNGRFEPFANAQFQAAYAAATEPTFYAFWQDRAANFWFCTNQGLFKLTDGLTGKIVVADFNLDGKDDLAIADLDDNPLVVKLGNGTGGFINGPAASVSVGSPGTIAVGDFNNDGKPDLVAAYATTLLSILWGRWNRQIH